MDHFLPLREKVFSFFKEKGHAVVPSSSLVPGDPSVLLTTAGMQQFKKYYNGTLNAKSDFGSSRATSIQKCFRTSDFEEVGDNTHLTFFEMIGNFSFGPVGSDDPTDYGTDGYFKRSAIVWAYEFVTNVIGISPERMHVTVFEGDERTPRDAESYRIWREEIGMPEDKILFGKREDNFWGPTGTEGPCGPTTEIYVDGIEIWNVVFNEYYARTGSDGLMSYEKMANPGIDTGMGFERLLTVLEGKKSVFETSSLEPLGSKVRELAPQLDERDIRIFTDHIRSAVFLMADGIEPSNKEAGYVLRRLLRKMIALAFKNDVHGDLFREGYEVVHRQYGEVYPEVRNEEAIMGIWADETGKFQESIAKGMRELAHYETISGQDAFHIYETFGLPFELIKELAPAHAVAHLERKDFDEAFGKHKDVSRAGAEKKFGGHGLVLDTGELKAATEEEVKKVTRMHTATHLLQWALRTHVDPAIHQMGSDITPERFRFDFNFDRKLTDEEVAAVEKAVNEQVARNLPVYYKEMPKDEALKLGALSFFREKYPDIVKVYFIGSHERGEAVSMELCGGPHVEQTSEIGTFKILKQESVGKGVRRIRATVLGQ
jgi:alanyl-tRNA synthetase